MKSRIAIAISALTLGSALAVIPAFAQTNEQPRGNTAQQRSSGCIVFQQGCSDKPYPMNNGEQSGTSQNRMPRSASSRERPSSEQFNGERERTAQGPARGTGQTYRLGERGAGETYGYGERGAGGTYGFGERERYSQNAPGVEVAGLPSRRSEWCEMHFRSYDPATGTYMGFDGAPHACP